MLKEIIDIVEKILSISVAILTIKIYLDDREKKKRRPKKRRRK